MLKSGRKVIIIAKAKITITGEVEKFKVNEDGTVQVVMKADTSATVPSGLKELGSSTYSISVSKKTWKKVSDKIAGNKILFTGEPKAAVSTKGAAFILVNCFDISVIEQKVKESKVEDVSPKQVQPEPKKAEQPKIIKTVKNEVSVINPSEIKPVPAKEPSKPKYANDDPDTEALNHWRKNHTDVKQIKVSDLILTEEEHYKGFTQGGLTFFKKYTIRKPLIVHPLDNGKYSLVIGFKDYIMAKILNFETVPAIIANYDRKGIIQEAWAEIKAMENEKTVKVVVDNG